MGFSWKSGGHMKFSEAAVYLSARRSENVQDDQRFCTDHFGKGPFTSKTKKVYPLYRKITLV
jgi:hypothetical protein